MPKRKKPATHFGHLEFDEALSAVADTPSIQRGRWVPHRRSLPKLPEGFEVPFQVIRVNDSRIIRPTAELGEFVKSAFYSGMRLLAATDGLTCEQRHSYRLMNLFMTWSLSPRRMHARSIEREEDLTLTRQGRRLLCRDSLLPDDLMSNRNGELRPATPKELVASGKEFARREGLGAVPFSRIVELGLLSHALQSRETPRLQSTDAESFIRFSLFGESGGTELKDKATTQRIEENLLAILRRHPDADPEKFTDWWDDFSALCRTLSRRSALKTVAPDQIRYVLHDLLLRAHRYASQCIEIQIQYITRLIRPRLTVPELRDATLWYKPQRWLSKCSPIVFHSRTTLLGSVLSLLSENPDRKVLWPAALQAMRWRTEILISLREWEQRRRQSPKTAFNLEDAQWDTFADPYKEEDDDDDE